MTDRELKKQFKKLRNILVIASILVISLSVYTLSSTKADLSIYNTDEYSNNLQALGINEEEFEKYLSIFGSLMVGTLNDNEKTLHMVCNFIDEMCAVYDETVDTNGLKCYDAEVVNNISRELKGQILKGNQFSQNLNYTYNNEKNAYVQNKILDEIPICKKIESITKDGEKIEVTYKLAIMTKEQLARGQEENVKTYTIKATILNNLEYEYSKYFVSNIEKITD